MIRPALIGIIIAGATLIGRADALDISGTYDDKGSIIGSNGVGSGESVSLHGLLSLEFDPVMAEANFGDTSHVVLVDKDGKIDIEIFDDNGTMIWGTVWGVHDGYSHEGDVAVIRISNGSANGDRTSLVMKTFNDGAYLEVKAYAVKYSAVGPHSEPIGSYIFVKEN